MRPEAETGLLSDQDARAVIGEEQELEVRELLLDGYGRFRARGCSPGTALALILRFAADTEEILRACEGEPIAA